LTTDKLEAIEKASDYLDFLWLMMLKEKQGITICGAYLFFLQLRKVIIADTQVT
jgi:sulfate adenylyltransferase subunit 1 (EFTu-like GTPase family)